MDTCDTVGVLNTIPIIIGSIQSTEAIKILVGKEYSKKIITFDVWSLVYNNFEIEKRKDCNCCGKKDFEYLDNISKERVITLCGSGVIQITPANRMNTSIEKLGEKLKNIGNVIIEDGFLRFQTEDFHFYVFKDGRALIYGTADENIAKSIYSKYIGL